MSALPKSLRVALRLISLGMLVVVTGIGHAHAAHRYFRMIVIEKQGGLNARVYEVEWKAGTTAHPTGAHTAGASCGGTPGNAYDGDWYNTCWSVAAVPCTLSLDLGAGTAISADSVRYRTWGSGRGVTHARFEGSADNATWDLLLDTTSSGAEGTYAFGLPGGAPAQQDVSPVLEFVCPLEGGAYVAHFGYDNPNPAVVSLPVGEENKFTGGGTSDWDQGQPTWFQPGRHYSEFTVDFDGSNLVWTLNGHTATASSASSQSGCTPTTEFTLQAAFAFGADSYSRETPNQPGAYYTKVVQNAQNYLYTTEQGHGYVDLAGVDGSPNNRNVLSGDDEIYDQFIGVKGGEGNKIVFRVDVPDGEYRFVVAGGDGQYGGHGTTIKVRDGTSGNRRVLLQREVLPANTFYTIGFEDFSPPTGDGSGTQPAFRPRRTSATLPVTSGHIEIEQIADGAVNGGDLCLLEVWRRPLETYSEWAQSRKLFLNTTGSGADVGEDVANFPLLVRVDPRILDFAEAEPNGEDIRFEDPDGTQLSYEIDTWDSAGLHATVWVLVPEVRGNSADDYVVMHWGKPGAADRSSPADVFRLEEGYEAAWHLSEGLPDATGAHGGIDHGSAGDVGIIGEGRSFGGSSEYIDAGIIDFGGTELTVMGWVRARSWDMGRDMRIVSKAAGVAESAHYFMLGEHEGGLRFRLKTNGITSTLDATDAILPVNEWVLVVASYDGATVRLYQDGLQVGSMAKSGDITGSQSTATWMGANPPDADSPFEGTMDEVRIARQRRGDAWIKLSHANQGIPDRLSSLPAVFIVDQASDTIVAEGESPLLKVVAGGGPVFAYQWYNGFDEPIDGATASSLRLSDVSIADEGEYYCRVTSNGDTARSAPIRLVVAEVDTTVALTPTDLDGDGIPDGVEDSLGSDKGNAGSTPEGLAVMDNWYSNPTVRTARRYDFSGVPDYSTRDSVWMMMPANTVVGAHSLLVQATQGTPASVPDTTYADSLGRFGRYFIVSGESADTTGTAVLALPFPDGIFYPPEVLHVERYTGQGWEPVAVVGVSTEAMIVPLGTLSQPVYRAFHSLLNEVYFVGDWGDDVKGTQNYVEELRDLLAGGPGPGPLREDQIWVTEGTYSVADHADSDRMKSFQLYEKLRLLGGFPKAARVEWRLIPLATELGWPSAFPYETEPSTGNLAEQLFAQRRLLHSPMKPVPASMPYRDPKTYQTILTGRHQSRDATQTNDVMSYTVVKGASNCTIDGFTISSGLSDGTGAEETRDGGGMYNAGVSGMVVHDCHFLGNQAGLFGGAMYNENAAIEMDRCTFTFNFAGFAGGALAILGENGYQISKCEFVLNGSETMGGAVVDYNSGGTWFDRCLFHHNFCLDGKGGGVMVWNTSSPPTLNHCTVAENEAAEGGGLWSEEPCGVRSSIFWGNQGGQIGSPDPGRITVSYSCIQGDEVWPSGQGNIKIEAKPQVPVFVAHDPTQAYDDLPYAYSWDVLAKGLLAPRYRLLPGTTQNPNPCRDNGDPEDLGEYPGLLAQRSDMGAFEYVSVMPLGNSITHGMRGGDVGYRGTLWNMLRVDFVGSHKSPSPEYQRWFDVSNMGQSGAIIGPDDDPIPTDPPSDRSKPTIRSNVVDFLESNPPPDIVLLVGGTNNIRDAGQRLIEDVAGTGDARIEAYIGQALTEMDGLLQRLRTGAPSSHVFVGSVPTFVKQSFVEGQSGGFAPYHPVDNNHSGRYNYSTIVAGVTDGGVKNMNRIANDSRMDFVDIAAHITEEDMADGVHPNYIGYRRMARAWFAAIVEAYPWMW